MRKVKNEKEKIFENSKRAKEQQLKINTNVKTNQTDLGLCVLSTQKFDPQERFDGIQKPQKQTQTNLIDKPQKSAKFYFSLKNEYKTSLVGYYRQINLQFVFVFYEKSREFKRTKEISLRDNKSRYNFEFEIPGVK
ncbi:hypothetical protein M0813_09089 [Anaeramoeba flamelloides]|uniref:SHSP domain-containing protein n=1 Tax=Anaeramoeba flamelloides TaxID=1746091 RepID=A0ABQ8X6R8_9EUKA|nr:hypothetical protein M0813_09089 [Anaeramoeba flamelloides]